MAATGVTVAAFDFDETLTHRDSVVPFLRRLSGTRSLAAKLVIRAHHLGPAMARRDRDRLRAIATQLVFTGRPLDEVLRLADEFGDELFAVGMRTDTVDRLLWHREAGHRTVIVSASYEHYLHVIGRHLGVDAVLATRLAVADGVCTGHLDGPNCRGPEKANRLRAWLAAEGLDRGSVTLWAYGDSDGDRELLAMADHPVWSKRSIGSVAPTP